MTDVPESEADPAADPTAPAPTTGPDPLLRADWVGTGVLTLGAVGAVLAPDTLALPYALVALVLFVAGFIAFVWAYAVAVGRSREEVISVAGVWFLSGSVPSGVRRQCFAALAVQVVVVVTAASLQPFTAVAFGVLAPLYGLGLAGLWAARHGTFPPRPEDDGRRRPR